MNAAKGDFGDVHARHAAAVYRFALYLCGDAAEAEDIAAETFARAWTSPAPLRAETVRSYLFTIARNIHAQRVRSAAKFVALPDTLEDGSSGARATEARDELRVVNAQLEALSAEDRTALLMRADGNTYEEIAAALGMTPGAVRVRVHRVRALLMRARIGGTQ
ncbi:MAG TPA: sigma-70 family RNA polymerase sigma factor [Gemmatimonadaceae bacterium]|nr:sigma-70 family RNA polymerase sigma factor [Gemmatimonadaceae bacterium]